jgi:hypothetical protein
MLPTKVGKGCKARCNTHFGALVNSNNALEQLEACAKRAEASKTKTTAKELKRDTTIATEVFVAKTLKSTGYVHGDISKKKCTVKEFGRFVKGNGPLFKKYSSVTYPGRTAAKRELKWKAINAVLLLQANAKKNAKRRGVPQNRRRVVGIAYQRI